MTRCKRSGTVESSPVCRASPLLQSILTAAEHPHSCSLFCGGGGITMTGAYGTAAARPSANRSFCTESKECLEYQLLCKTDEYEVRHYSPTRWVSTDAEAYFMGVGAAMAFRRLFQYITGANQEGVQMEMTTPVLVKIPEETKMWEPAIYTLNFPLPAAYQEKPPKPTNDKASLYFTEMPDLDIYVRSYGGWMLSVTSRLHAHLLTKELDREPTPAHTPTPTPTALSGMPTGAPFAAALRALRHSPAAAAAVPSNQALDAPASDSASTVVPSSAVPAVSSLNLPTQSPSPVAHEAVFSLPLTSAQSPVEPSTNSSVSPSPEPQTVSGAQNVTDFQTVPGLDTITGPQNNVSESQAVTGLADTLTGPGQNDGEQETLTGPQNVSDLQTVTGPQNARDSRAVTAPQNMTGSQIDSELAYDSGPWNDTAQGGPPEAQGDMDLAAMRSDAH
ncbi:hypothetical protein CRUP_007246 [Coryphaenoides rupestris]|nr:hypothetical protein CRUP_007246 [Coryphaenoides rupestris]